MNITYFMDLLSGKKVNRYYKEYLKTQWYSVEKIREYQFIKLRKLIHHCYEHVPYYREYMDENNIKIEDIKSIEDLKLFPILTKEIIQANYEKFIPANIREIKGVKTSQTGGTTGNILFKRSDANTRSSIWGSYKRFQNDWMKVKDRDKKLILMGGHVVKHGIINSLKFRFIHYIQNEKVFDVYNTTDENYFNIKKVLLKSKFIWIRGYPQFIFFLAKRLKNETLNFNIKAISTTAEPLTLEHRTLFKEVFHAELFDQYGCGEIGGIAYECEKHNGLHVTEERVILEVNNNNEIIITDLDNYSMPFIRYWNADQVVLSKEECPCGRKSTLIKEILGRTCDYIIGVNGEFLHWAYFWHLFFDSNVAQKRNLRRFQVVQIASDQLLLRIVADEFSDEEKIFFREDIQQRLGKIEIKFSFEDDIELTKTGKYRPVVNKLLS